MADKKSPERIVEELSQNAMSARDAARLVRESELDLERRKNRLKSAS